MRMSALSYITLGLATAMVAFAYAVNPDTQFLITAVPMILVVGGVPLLFNYMNQRRADSVDMQSYRLYKIKDLDKLGSGTPVRIRGTVEKTTLKWLNRPNYKLNDGSGEVGVFLLASPRDEINIGDSVEAAGVLRPFGAAREKKVWGARMERVSS